MKLLRLFIVIGVWAVFVSARTNAAEDDIEDLAKVPLIELGDAQNAKQLGKIKYYATNSHDAYLESLREQRPNLASLPFLIGDAGRLARAEREKFAAAVFNVRESLRQLPTRDALWNQHIYVPEDRHGVAALMQMLAAESPWKPGLIEHLIRSESKEATQALARLAIFPGEEWIRRLAREGLQRRDTGPATDVLLLGLRYPLPAVARHSAELLVQLRRNDLAPALAKMLHEPDPRAPMLQETNGEKSYVLRELVRINHLRNCLLCHPPAITPDVCAGSEGSFDTVGGLMGKPALALLREVPDPSKPLPPYFEFREPIPGLSVRADVTYLRQDFSLLQQVAGANPWPAMQRFDFLIRTRLLTDAEARACQEEFLRAGDASPYHQAALTALSALSVLSHRSDGTTWGKQRWIAFGCVAFAVLPCWMIYRRRCTGARIPS